MKELERIFIGRGEVRGVEFRQIEANDKGYLYEVVNGDRIYYEVFRRKENTQFNCVSYPSAKAFGNWAWTTASLDRANEIFAELNTEKEPQLIEGNHNN